MLKDALRHSLRLLGEGDESPTWLDCIDLEDEGDAVRVVFPHVYFGPYFAPHRERLEQALRHALARSPLHIRYDVRLRGRRSPRLSPALTARVETSPGQTAQTFASFLHNDKNAFAVAATRLLLREESDARLLVLHGASGTGKSHLLHALLHALQSSGRRVVGVSLANRQDVRFPWEQDSGVFWQGCDQLLIDDLHEVLDNEQRCRGLVACMDAAARTGGRMALAFTGSPRRLEAAPAALRTRLESGLLLELLPPDADVRLRYVQDGCRKLDLHLGAATMMRLARRYEHFRPLQGLLRRLQAFLSLNGRAPTEEEVDDMLRLSETRGQEGCRDIMEAAAAHYGVRADDLTSDKRHPRLVLARQIAMYVCRRELGLSYPELGRIFGGKDHSTVIHAVKKIEKMLVNDKNVHRAVNAAATRGMK